MGNPVKVTVNLPEDTVEALKQMATDQGTTITEALRQAIESQHYLREETRGGKNLLLQDPSDRSLQRVIFNAPPRARAKGRT
jgi:hypothetical protein